MSEADVCLYESPRAKVRCHDDHCLREVDCASCSVGEAAFVEDLQRSLIRSGRVDFVASTDERAGIRQERADQDLNASDSTRKAMGQETGADFVLSGTFTSIEDRSGGTTVVMYQVNLKLLDVRTNRIAWNGQKKIKKQIDRASTTW